MNSNHLINLLAAQDKDGANTAFESLVQDKLTDALEVRKVELASNILGIDENLNEDRHTHQVVYTVPGEGKEKQYYHVTADDEDHAREQLLDAQPTAKIHKVEPITKDKPVGGFGVHEGTGMAAQRKWVRQVSAIGKGYENTDRGHKVSIHRAELKQAARKVFKQHAPHGAEFLEKGAAFVKDARKAVSKKANEETEQTNEALEAGSAPTNAQLNRNVLANIRKATQALRVKNVNPTLAAAAHRDFGKLVAKNPKAPGYMLLRKLAPNKAAAVQTLTQAGVPLGGALEAHPNDFNQAIQRIKRFK